MGPGTITEIAARDAGTSSRGPRGAHGLLRVRAEVVAGRTRLTRAEQRPPLAVMRAHHLDAAVPDLASVTVVSPGGGILQGDRLEQEFEVRRGARLSVGTQSSLRVYRTPHAAARSETTLVCEPRAYLEYLPDPWIPYAGSRLAALTRCIVDASATLLVSEAVVAGRLARGERFALDRFESLITVERPAGEPFIRDTLRIDPLEAPDVTGRFGEATAVATLLIVGPGIEPDLVRHAIEPGVSVGISALPDGAGAWLRVLGPDARTVTAVVQAARAAVRTAVLGRPPTADRRP